MSNYQEVERVAIADVCETKAVFLDSKIELLRSELDASLEMQTRRGLGVVSEASRVAFSFSSMAEIKDEACGIIQRWWRRLRTRVPEIGEEEAAVEAAEEAAEAAEEAALSLALE